MVDCSKGSTAANWMPGNPIIAMPPKNYNELENRIRYIEKNRNGISWYLSFNNPPEICEKTKEQ